MAVIIYHEEMGIHLGSCLGLGFWSKLDPAGQEAAVTFPDEQTAKEYMAGWESECKNPLFIEVSTAANGYASIQECIAAGLPGWIS